MRGLERINSFILEKGFNFQVVASDMDQGFRSVRSENSKVWYKLVAAGEVLACFFGDWRGGVKHQVFSQEVLTAGDERAIKKLNKEIEAERSEQALVAKAQVEELWERWLSMYAGGSGSHYLERKQLTESGGVVVRGGSEDAQQILVIPMYDEFLDIWNLQQIYRSGKKVFHTQARTKGLFHLLEGAGETIFIGEGYATCRAVNEATGARVYVAFSSGNLESVLRMVVREHGARSVVLLADYDGATFLKTGENAGMYACQSLATKYRVRVAVPVDLSAPPSENLDFSDLWGSCGHFREQNHLPFLTPNEWCSWERLSLFTFKTKKDKPKKDVVEKAANEPVVEAAGEPLLLGEPPRKIPVDNEPDDADFPSKAHGFFMQVPKLKADGSPAFGADGKPLMKDLPDYVGFSRYVGRRFFLKTNDAFSYLYEDDHYRQVSVLQLKNTARVLLKENTAPKVAAAFVDDARAANFIRSEDLVEPKGLINLKNGVLDVRNRRLMAHSPEYFFKYRLPHEYVAGAQCPEWLEFLVRTFEGNQELVDVCAEIFGYILLGGEPFLHKAFVLSGEGRNGKSTFLDVLKHMIGKTNFSSIPVGQLEKPFSAIMADGKLANIVGETSTKEINSETFKTACGGEELIAAQKGMPEYAMPFHARIVMACNRLPHLGDATTGAHEKFFILPFDRYLQESERTALFAQKKLFPEISGVMNWALDGLERLVRRGGLPTIGAVKAQALELREETDTVFAWFNEFVVFDDASQQKVQFKNFYGSYQLWCKQQGRQFAAQNTFCKRIAAELRKFPHCLTSFPARVLTVTSGLRITAKPAPALASGY